MKTKTAMEQCPRFERCEAPLCPLDPGMNKRIYIGGEPVCEMEKRVRMRLGKDLPNGGLWAREIAAKKRYESLSEDQKMQMHSRMAEFALKRQKIGSSGKSGGKADIHVDSKKGTKR